jgi:hypothetical protein
MGEDDLFIRQIKVNRIYRSDPIPDIPPTFPPLDNLHLEMIENKKKLKKSLPLIPPSKPVTALPDDKPQKKEKEDKKDEDEEDEETEEFDLDDEEAEMMDELGDSSSKKTKSSSGKTESKSKTSSSEEETPEEEEKEHDPYAGLTPEQIEKKKKDKYLWKFHKLRKGYHNPDSEKLPSFNEHSDLYTMKTVYKRTVREINLERNISSYRMWLAGGCTAMEWVMTNWMGIDIGGFSSQQAKNMDQYDHLLIELGEREYNSWGSSLPVEVRLIGMVLLQAVFFYIGKKMADSGEEQNSFFSMFQPQQQPQAEEPKKKMKGPRIKPEDLFDD